MGCVDVWMYHAAENHLPGNHCVDACLCISHALMVFGISSQIEPVMVAVEGAGSRTLYGLDRAALPTRRLLQRHVVLVLPELGRFLDPTIQQYPEVPMSLAGEPAAAAERPRRYRVNHPWPGLLLPSSDHRRRGPLGRHQVTRLHKGRFPRGGSELAADLRRLQPHRRTPSLNGPRVVRASSYIGQMAQLTQFQPAGLLGHWYAPTPRSAAMVAPCTARHPASSAGGRDPRRRNGGLDPRHNRPAPR